MYTPTYLYIKQHSITGLLYFGKTTQNPIKYYGSGFYWKLHINKYGRKFIETLWYCLFLNQDDLTKFALNFSMQENIVESKQWANLCYENGLDGGDIWSSDVKQEMSNSRKGAGNPFYGKRHSEETIRKIKISNVASASRGISQSIVKCPHCGKEGGNTMYRWHFDKCKSRVIK